MGQQEGNHEATGPGVEEELDPFEQLAAALEAWEPDISGDKKTLRLRKWDINLQTWRPLELLIDWLKYRKNYDFANGFEGEFRQLYTEAHEFYEKVAEGAFTEDELFNEQIPFLKDSAERLALYVVRVKAMCENDAGIEADTGGEAVRTRVAEQECEAEGTRSGATAKKSKRDRATKASMARRNEIVTAIAVTFKARSDRWPTVDEIVEKTKLKRHQVYSTHAYKESKIEKSSAKSAPEMLGGSVHGSEYYTTESIEHTRAVRRSKTKQEELDALLDEQEKDDRSTRVPKPKRI